MSTNFNDDHVEIMSGEAGLQPTSPLEKFQESSPQPKLKMDPKKKNAMLIGIASVCILLTVFIVFKFVL